MSVVQPTQNQILRFLQSFRAEWKETGYDMMVEPRPYPEDAERTFLFQYCLKNGYIEEVSRNRFHDFYISYLGEWLLLVAKSRTKRFRLWIEDNPTIWASLCALGWYLFPYIHEALQKLLM